MSVATFIKDKSLLHIFHTFEKITFKSFLINIYSLGHERRKIIHTLDFHRKLMWTSQSTTYLFWSMKKNLRNEGTSLFGFPGDMSLAGVTDFVFETGSPVADGNLELQICLLPLSKCWDYTHEHPCWLYATARVLCILGDTLPTELCSQPTTNFSKWLGLPGTAVSSQNHRGIGNWIGPNGYIITGKTKLFF